MTGTATRIGIADHHTLIRDGLRAAIEGNGHDIEVVLEAETTTEALGQLEAVHARDLPDIEVMLVNTSIPGIGGIELASRIREQWPKTRTILFSGEQDAQLIEQAIRNKVWGYLLTTEPMDVLFEAIETVCEGDCFFRCGLSPDVISSYQRSNPSTKNLETAITPRQVEVLGLICEGKTEREIADVLGISHNTVHVHKNNIMQALQIHSKVGLVRYAALHNLISL
ncbi:MAG: response regulator transcription factor [Spirochaetales bacterium]